MIEVQNYQHEWPMWYNTLSTWLHAQLITKEGQAVRFVSTEHVGSTAVPGLAAKPIIDLDIIVTVDQLQPVLQALEAHGHVNRGELGIPDRYAIRLCGPPRPSNTYVVLQDSIALRNHLAVRDTLRTHDTLRQKYELCKRELASKTDDIGEYCEGKSAVLSEILACAGCLSAEEIQSIHDNNRR